MQQNAQKQINTRCSEINRTNFVQPIKKIVMKILDPPT